MARLVFHNSGFSLTKSARRPCVHKGGGRRGKISGAISSASFRRLREFCITHTIDEKCWGITLTVPGLDLISDVDFRKAHHKLVVWCNDNRVPIIWRIELQKRGMPHIHLVTYGTQKDCLKIMKHWYKCLHGLPLCYDVCGNDLVEVPRDLVDGSRFAVCLDSLSGGFASFRYLVSHMAKHKQEQLGWKGRQWGVCCKSLFEVCKDEERWLSDKEFYRLRRWVRRCTRRKIGPRGCAYWVSDPVVVCRMHDYIVERKPNGGGAESAVPVRGARPLWLYSWFGLHWLQNLDFLTFDLVLRDTRDSCCLCIEDIVSFYVFVECTAEKVPFLSVASLN